MLRDGMIVFEAAALYGMIWYGTVWYGTGLP